MYCWRVLRSSLPQNLHFFLPSSFSQMQLMLLTKESWNTALIPCSKSTKNLIRRLPPSLINKTFLLLPPDLAISCFMLLMSIPKLHPPHCLFFSLFEKLWGHVAHILDSWGILKPYYSEKLPQMFCAHSPAIVFVKCADDGCYSLLV